MGAGSNFYDMGAVGEKLWCSDCGGVEACGSVGGHWFLSSAIAVCLVTEPSTGLCILTACPDLILNY